ncbi:MAG TPA: class I adenylate-forming enzyme family protein, partial [Sphingomicrobium sp.]|nr:class I adenylate-forming enzyme family protein [Sphingomicrobium sp.]
MRNELDRRFDEELAKVTGPGGRLSVGEDEQGRAVVTNLPSTLPAFFKAFCALNGANEAVVAGNERLTFADLDRISDGLAQALLARGIVKGDRVAIAMRNCPAWIISYMAIAKVGAIATLLNGWWEPAEMEHAITLTEPKLIIADDARGRRILERCGTFDTVCLPISERVEDAIEPLLRSTGGEFILPQVSADDDATILFTSGSTGDAKGAVSTNRAVTTGVYAYSTGLAVLLGLLTQDGKAPATPPRTLLSVPLFHVTGEVPVMLNSFVIGRCMVIMPKWDATEALRLIEKERITYFVGVP